MIGACRLTTIHLMTSTSTNDSSVAIHGYSPFQKKFALSIVIASVRSCILYIALNANTVLS